MGRRVIASLFVAVAVMMLPMRSASAQLTYFDSIALEGLGNSTYIRFDHGNDPDFYMIRFPDYFALWTGATYSCRFYDTASADTLLVTGSGLATRKALTIRDADGVIDLTMFHENAQRGFNIRSVASTNGQNGGIGINHSGRYPFYVYQSAESRSLAIDGEGVCVGDYNARAPLHVYADGTPFSEAKVLVENNLSGSPAVREMVNLVNNGGVSLAMRDTSLDVNWNLVSTGNGSFGLSKGGTGGSEFLIHPNGRVVMGLGGANRFDLRANGNLFIAGTLMQSSDKNLKTAFANVDEQDILSRVSNMNVQTWQFKSDEPELRHMGPTAQDFHAAFGLGPDEKTIAPVDGIGVSLAAIKALKREGDQKDKTIKTLTIQVDRQERELTELKTRLASQTKLLQTLTSRMDQWESQTGRTVTQGAMMPTKTIDAETFSGLELAQD